MNQIPITLAVEDELSERVLKRLLREANGEYAIGATLGRKGNGYLRKTLQGWNRAAQGSAYVVLTDLDNAPCAPRLVQNWFGNSLKHPNLLFRVAIREVESWLLADRPRLSQYLSVHEKWMPEEPEIIPDPKRELIDLVGRYSKSPTIKAQLLPKPGSTARQGREHNACLGKFADSVWKPSVARKHSPSLDRALRCFESFRPVFK